MLKSLIDRLMGELKFCSVRESAFMSAELKSFLLSKGIATSRSTPYNPKGNGQVERYNGIIWKAVTLALKSRGLDSKRWEEVLPDVLHSIRSLLCTATNCTPHERMFLHMRTSTNGPSLPSWLTNPGTVWLKKTVRNSKQDALVEEVQLIEANPEYAHIRHADGQESTKEDPSNQGGRRFLPSSLESTVSLRHLAPKTS